MTRPARYPQEVRERAVRMVFEHEAEHPSQWAAICSIADKFGMTRETLRRWVRMAETDEGLRPGLTTEERERLKGLEREVRELRPCERDPEVRVGFLRGGARPPTDEIIAYIDINKDRFGVEPICKHLPIAPSTKKAGPARNLRIRQQGK
jgi:transposase-like protein